MKKSGTVDRQIQQCCECRSAYFVGTSAMFDMCPECSHLIYGYENCPHEFEEGCCKLCGWDGRRSRYTKRRFLENRRWEENKARIDALIAAHKEASTIVIERSNRGTHTFPELQGGKGTQMPGSIYDFVKKKLISHGVDRTPDGLVTLENKLLFLTFVQLERAVRIADFDAVQSAVKRIDECAGALGKRHLIVFAYMYLRFSDGTPEMTHADVIKDDGGVLRSVEYRRAVTPEERLIADWGRLCDERYGKNLLRAVYASEA